MKFFILEDDPERMKIFFSRILVGREIVHFAEVNESSKEAMLKNEWEAVFLDHDLGGETFVNSGNENTGYQLAKFMVENKISVKEIYIHSMNPYGAQNIASVLKTFYNDSIVRTVPFNLLKNSKWV